MINEISLKKQKNTFYFKYESNVIRFKLEYGLVCVIIIGRLKYLNLKIKINIFNGLQENTIKMRRRFQIT